MNQNLRTLLAAALSMMIVLGWQHFFVPEEMINQSEEEVFEQTLEEEQSDAELHNTIEDGFKNNTRVKFENAFITGSINMVGAQIDNLILKKYQGQDGDDLVLLAPEFSDEPNFIRIAWKAKQGIELPTNQTVWLSHKGVNNEIILTWINSQKILFKIEITHDDVYLLKINTTIDSSKASIVTTDLKIRGYISMQRSRNASITDSMILHEGPIGVVDNKLQEVSFSKVNEDNYIFTKDNVVDWVGFSDKYWLVTFIPGDKDGIAGNVTSSFSNDWAKEKYQMDILLKTHKLDVKVISESFMLFAGAKSIEVLDAYEKSLNIPMFDRAVDLGFLYFITKPIFLVLNYFYKALGNFGLAIMLLTVITKVLLFPLAYKSAKSMNKIKKIQPKINKLKEQYVGNTVLFQQALVALYKKEKVNPAAGCLPIILQMPIFFALYKVLYVTIEMRHAPFFWWITDLSAPDSTTFFNLFGLIPWQPPLLLMVGILPVLMSLTMYIQQQMNPQPTDSTQAMVMKMMPLFLLFMFAQFPSGLLIYWTWSNIISIIQQMVIKYMPE
jgi:YidC/Oxa1 family membrane protein insertase